MQALLLVDHGSRRHESNTQLASIAALVQQRLGERVSVAYAHMELAEPSISSAIEHLARGGASSIIVVPYFLAPGRHAYEDIPRLASEAAARWRGVRVKVSQELGIDETLADLVIRRAIAAGLAPGNESDSASRLPTERDRRGL